VKIVLIGAKGMLAYDLGVVLGEHGHEVVPVTHEAVDVCDRNSVMRVLQAYKPQVLINTAAVHPVEVCEREPERSFAVNALALRSLAQICRELECVLVHFSSDFVFDGKMTRPYREEDAVSPLNVYGTSKAAGEYFVRAIHSEHILIRCASLFGIAGNRAKGCNFVELMLRKASRGESIRVVDDVRMSPTYTVDIARQLVLLLEGGHFGTFHVCNHGDYSWFEFARRIFELKQIDADLKPIPHEMAGWGGPRPLYSVLRNKRLEEMGLDRMRTSDEALKSYLSERTAVASGLVVGDYKGPTPVQAY
jgi:dTDP-4-dehydrorhamnose reductase